MKRVKLVERREVEVLETIPDSVEMTRETFLRALRRNPGARKFGFSVKHTKDIANVKKLNGAASTLPHNLYNLPVQWNIEKTFIA